MDVVDIEDVVRSRADRRVARGSSCHRLVATSTVPYRRPYAELNRRFRNEEIRTHFQDWCLTTYSRHNMVPFDHDLGLGLSKRSRSETGRHSPTHPLPGSQMEAVAKLSPIRMLVRPDLSNWGLVKYLVVRLHRHCQTDNLHTMDMLQTHLMPRVRLIVVVNSVHSHSL